MFPVSVQILSKYRPQQASVKISLFETREFPQGLEVRRNDALEVLYHLQDRPDASTNRDRGNLARNKFGCPMKNHQIR